MPDGATYYVDFIRQELNIERERRDTLNARGQAVVTASAALVALLGTVNAISADRKTEFFISQSARYSLFVALIFFIIAAFFGVLTTYSFKFTVAKESDFKKMMGEHAADSKELAERATAHMNIRTIAGLRKGNNRKAGFLLIALFVQLVALFSTGAGALFAVAG